MSDQQSGGLGVAPNVGGLLCYAPCIGLVWAIVVLIVEKQSRFMRFHAVQSLLFLVAWTIVGVGVTMVSIIAAFASSVLGWLIGLLAIPIHLGLLGLSIFMMVKAYGNEQFEIPVIGPMAKQWASN